jgi:hypothetical protein
MARVDFYSEEESIDEELLSERVDKIVTILGHPEAL